jgi:hypothetical protein
MLSRESSKRASQTAVSNSDFIMLIFTKKQLFSSEALLKLRKF